MGGPRRSVSLRWKLLGFALGIALAFVGSAWVIHRGVAQPAFANLEERDAREHLERVEEAIARDSDFLARYAQDYGAWDDTLAYLATRSPAYEEANLSADTLENLESDALILVDSDRMIVWAKRRDRATAALVDDPQLVAVLINPALGLVSFSDPTARRSGIVMTREGAWLVGAAPITDTEKATPPRGALIYARAFDAEQASALGVRTRVSLEFSPAPRTAPAQAHWLDTASEDTLFAHTLLRDVRGEPALVARVALPRAISAKARTVATATTLASALVAVALLTGTWLVLSHFVVDPLERLTGHAVRVGSSGDLGARLSSTSEDEIGVLAREFDAMVERLEASRAQLLGVAHNAGRAEVARGVLHDIGNVMNSISVSASVVSETVARSELASLRQALALLQSNANQLPDFFSSDPRAPHLLPFLDELAGALEAEQSRALAELKTLGAAALHAATLVRRQNQTAEEKAAVIEWLDPAAVAEQAAALAHESFARHKVALERRFQRMERAPLDRQRCLQVLTNLLANAKNAVRDAKRGGGTVLFAVSCIRDADGDWIEFVVGDNGVGIAPEYISAIFSMGFTTRSDGHGIGLHSAANVARELGGSLRAESAGPGLGATFFFRVPAREDRA
jgi:sensor domain CHASE-containing protein